jgi:hypothetical protein
MTTKTIRRISIIFFSIGVIIGLFFAGSVIWANFELTFYFNYSYASIRSADQAYSDLECPIILTKAETGMVRTDIANTTDKTLTPVFRGEISYLGGIVREVDFKPTILPRETSRVEFEVNSHDLFYNYFILVRTYQLPTYKTPSRIGSCAIVMLPIPFLTGRQVFYLSLFAIGLFQLTGIFLWTRSNRPLQGVSRRAYSAMITLSLLEWAAIIFGIYGIWVAGLPLMVAIVLLIVVASIGFSGGAPQEN